ncbi:ATP synthase gamma chain [Waddlia chondrophila 2032/99]|uniref:ATP synthase gamma chain n=2 Tax=Waddlia chondrophila TaxID=71667 RepID=D6YWH3_WADCW|nr:ATP synthase F1 subunit gamma [Waddlia chondrophila]ADI38484.1 F-type ATP synthase, subunit gamma [Waddlia chondrophila WSU 86-1044]CCB91566.1 ATP synthase gamma chain [Waddlia chondrophila 2032/99]
MLSLKEIRKRIRSVENIQQITKSMEMVAAARLQKALVQAEHSHDYVLSMHDMLPRLIATATRDCHPLLKENKTGSTLFIAASTDRGLCGAYNSNLFSALDRLLKETHTAELIIFGGKGIDYYHKKKQKIAQEIPGWGGKISTQTIKTFAEGLIKNYLLSKYKKINLIYTKHQTIFSRTIINKQLLPIPKKTKPIERDYILEPSLEELLTEFLSRYCIAEIQEMLNQAYVSELAARVLAMRAAAKNADTMIENLTLLSNKVRQAGITSEMLEIMIGAEAMK